MKRRLVMGLSWAALACLSLFAVTPRFWEFRSMPDFLKGKFDGVSVSPEGRIALAPRIENLAAPAEEFYLSFLSAADGSLFLGTGHSGKVFRIGKNGEAELYFQTAEMNVTSLARDGKGVLYAATSPNGKIYKITAKGQGQEFFNPGEKYIWDLMFRVSGSLLAAVGERGGIYEITPEGQGRILMRSDENHVLCLLSSGKAGGLLAGSGGGGVVYQVAADGRSSVVFESTFEEIRSLAVDAQGMIYAAAAGTRSKIRKEEAPAVSAPVAPAVPGGAVSVSISVSASPETPFGPPARTGDGGAVFRIAPDGVARSLWNSEDEMVYSLILREDGTVLFGTGPQGRIYALDGDGRASLWHQKSSEQIYLLIPDGPRTYILANNPCSLDLMHYAQGAAGEYLGSVLDSGTVSSWGRVEWDADVPSGTTLQVQTRSGNTLEPNATWSDWSPPYQKKDEPILSPRGRYLQYRVLFKSTSGNVSPALDRIRLFYLQTNIAPVVRSLEILPPHEVFIKLGDQDEILHGVEPHLPGPPVSGTSSRGFAMTKKAERKGFRTVVWAASDENDDALIHRLFMRKEGEAAWRKIQDAWTESLYTFDTMSFPDGIYHFKVEASDAPSNPPGTELSGERISRPFVIDNTPPEIVNFKAARNRDVLEVSFEAQDAFSHIEDVRFQIRPDAWRVVFPVDGISDSRREAFKFTVKLPPGADNMIVVRVRDAAGNVGVTRQVF